MQIESFAMEAMKEPKVDQDKLADLLFLVRSIISAGGCTDKIDAERWLMTWLDTPNSALGGVKPRRLLEQAYNRSTMR